MGARFAEVQHADRRRRRLFLIPRKRGPGLITLLRESSVLRILLALDLFLALALATVARAEEQPVQHGWSAGPDLVLYPAHPTPGRSSKPRPGWTPSSRAYPRIASRSGRQASSRRPCP